MTPDEAEDLARRIGRETRPSVAAQIIRPLLVVVAVILLVVLYGLLANGLPR